MKYLIILLIPFSTLVTGDVDISFKLSARDIVRYNELDGVPDSRMGVTVRAEGWSPWGGIAMKTAVVTQSHNPDYRKEFFVTVPNNSTMTFKAELYEFLRNGDWYMGMIEFTAQELMNSSGTLMKRLKPDQSMKIIITSSAINAATCSVVCNSS